MKYFVLYSFFIVLILKPSFLQSQGTIQGQVLDQDKQVLSFVSVQIKGSTDGTSCDELGKFQISTSIPATLILTLLGYETKEITVTSYEEMEIIMQNSSKLLDQVIVVGYGTSKKSDITGSSIKIKSSEISQLPVLTASQAIQGRAAGVSIINSGAPGSTPNVRIRGVGSVLGGADPLYIVDGIITSDIRNISANDIENIDILKDASSTAIYGARAANGVILITTKNSSKKKIQINYNNQLGVRILAHAVEMSPPGYYAQYCNIAADFPAVTAGEVTGSTDWYKEITRPALFHQHHLSINGKVNRYNYFLSASVLNENGLLIDNNYNRYTLRYNHEYKLLDNLKIGNTISFSRYISNNKPHSLFTTAYIAAPIFNALNPDGTFGNVSNVINNVGNPLATLKNTLDRSYGNRYQTTFFGEYTLFKNWKAKSQFSADIEYNNGWEYIPEYATYLNNGTKAGQQNELPDLRFNRDTSYQWVWDNTLTYEKNWRNIHDLKFLVGHTAERRDGWKNIARIGNYNIQNDSKEWRLNFVDTARGQQNMRDPIDNYFRRESYFARLNYKLKSRYILSATIRRDANSNFPKSNRWGNFPSVGIAWLLSQEKFISNIKWIDELKIRSSFGLVGNDVIRPGQFDLRPTERLYTYFGVNRIDGATVLGIVDPNLKWEVVRELDFGVEFSLMNQKWSGEIDLYHKKATDALFVIPYAAIGFGNSLLTNAADIVNKGIEFALKYRFSTSRNFKHTIATNLSFNKNRVEKVGLGRALNFGNLNNGSSATQTLAGEEIGSFWVYKTDGLFQTEAEVNATPHIINAKPGDLKIVDVNKDGLIDNLDRVHVGSYQPKMIIGLNYQIAWKNWDLSCDIFSLLGNKVYNGKKGIRFGSNYNVELDVAKKAWTPGSGENKNPRPTNVTPYPTDYFVENGSFVRINNITLGYQHQSPNYWNRIEKIRYYVGAQNPFLFTKYTGFTPELPGNQNEAGIEINVYPISSVFLIGLNVEFR
jgi:TonB-linked SusC/RagA family outer membrane protein